jgi:hypothetical protein
VVKSQDYIVAWSYDDEKRMRFSYSGVRRESSKAYTMKEVSELIEKSQKEILKLISRNLVDRPSGRLYTIKNKLPGKWMWSESDILALREAIFELAPKNKYGEPFSNFTLISKKELLSKLHEDTSYYVKGSDGQFVKVWRAT